MKKKYIIITVLILVALFIYMVKIRDKQQIKSFIGLLNVRGEIEIVKDNEIIFYTNPGDLTKEEYNAIENLADNFIFCAIPRIGHDIPSILKQQSDDYYKAGNYKYYQEVDNKLVLLALDKIEYLPLLKYKITDFFYPDLFSGIGQYSEAIVFFDRAIEKDAKNYNALYKRGECYFYLEQYKNAIIDFEQFYSNNEDEKQTLELIGDAYYYLKDYNQALKYYKEYLKFNESVNVKFNLGLVNESTGNNMIALKIYNSIIENDKGANLVIIKRSHLLLKLKKYTSSIKDINYVLNNSTTLIKENDYYLRANIYKGLGKTLLEKKDIISAIELLTKKIIENVTTLIEIKKSYFKDSINEFDSAYFKIGLTDSTLINEYIEYYKETNLTSFGIDDTIHFKNRIGNLFFKRAQLYNRLLEKRLACGDIELAIFYGNSDAIKCALK